MGGSRPVEIGLLDASGANDDLADDLAEELPEKRAFDQELGHSVGVADYLRLALLVTALETIGGALGSVVESDPLRARGDLPRRAGEEARGRGGDDAKR